MNWFNFRNKTNNEVSEETSKAYWEWEKNEKLNLPSSEETIKTIINEFRPEQLKKLDITTSTGELISFERQLKAKYGHLNPVSSIEKTQSFIKDQIQKYEKILDIAGAANIYFWDRCAELFENSN